MKRSLVLALGAALLLGACASTSDAEKDAEIKLPTQSEADATAKHRINQDNADAELKALEAEIAADKP